jgi:hypothetical protein
MTNEDIKNKLLQLYECKTDFTVIQTGKKSSKVNGFYRVVTHEIFLHNKNFNSDNQLMYTAVHELTHHILDTEKGVKTARCHSGAFYSTFYNLIDKAVDLHFYSRNRNTETAELIKEANDIQKQITDLQKKLGKVLIKIQAVCDKNSDRFEDVIEHDCQISRQQAHKFMQMSAINLSVSEEILNALSIKSSTDAMTKQAAIQATAEGKTVQQIKAIAQAAKPTDNGLESPEKLLKEKQRLEKTIDQLNDRLIQVEETLRSMGEESE